LVFKKPEWDLPKGVAFKRLNAGGEQPAGGMCNWCHAYGSSEEIGMLSVTINANVSFSYILCHDLRCIEKIEEASTLSGKSPDKAIDQLYYKMGQFFEGMSQHQL
ncbi:MAG: FBP domain-containing protein, partial [Bdellovibrionaceae bacterium]|nr:FBP domain-containing protein [Pseudobdellovibrionaceae bacterium]